MNKEKPDTNPAAMAAAMAGDIENAVIASTPGGIEEQEAQGQTGFVVSEHLPVDAPWDKLHAMGIKELDDHNEVASRGELFCKVALPPGWKRVATDHSMWTDLVDEKGIKRAAIFYKAAFYDRRAFLHLV